MKRALLVACLVVKLLYVSVASAQDVRTQWTPTEKSLTALLNEGWRIISHSEAHPVIAISSPTTNPAIQSTYSFLLMKENKVVICIIWDPKPNNATSRCRALN